MTAYRNTMYRSRPVRDEEETFTVSIHAEELQRIANWVAEYPRRETGGDLFGFWTHSGAPAVQLTLGPGPGARHETAAFFQDVDYLRTHGQRAQAHYGVQHIGDWHSHHELGLAEPSSGDVATALRTLELNGFPRFLIFVANIRPGEPARRRRQSVGQVQLNAFLFEQGRSTFRRGRFLVLPGESPTGASAEREGIVERRSADRAPVAVPLAAAPAARTRPQGWFTQEWGTDFLRTVDAACREWFDDCRMTVTADDGALTYQFTDPTGAWSIAFPAGFPNDRACMWLGDRLADEIELAETMTAADFCRQIAETVELSAAGRAVPPDDVPAPAADGDDQAPADGRSDVE